MKIPARLLSAKRGAEKALLALNGVTGVAIAFKQIRGEQLSKLAIRVTVQKKQDVPPEQEIPKFIRGYPTDVIERTFHNLATIDSNLYDPLLGGISAGPCREVSGSIFAGTLGAIVVDRGSAGELMMLSNFHVFGIDEDAAEGDTIAQPSRIEGGICPDHIAGTLTRWHLGETVDCAVAAISESNRTAIAQVQEIGPVYGTTGANLGDKVKKRGRTTGLTTGIVDAVDLTITTLYEGTIGNVTLTGQIGISPDVVTALFVTHGDSGSVVMSRGNKVCGLIYAGSSDGHGIANPIQDVLDIMDVDLYLTAGAAGLTSWPATIPLSYIDATGQPLNPILASDLASAHIERRLRYFGDYPISLSLVWQLSISEYADFKAFFSNDIDEGAAIFAMELRHPLTSDLKEWQCRFDSEYGSEFQEGVWKVTARVTALRLNSFAIAAGLVGYSPLLVHPDHNPVITSDGFEIFVKL